MKEKTSVAFKVCDTCLIGKAMLYILYIQCLEILLKVMHTFVGLCVRHNFLGKKCKIQRNEENSFLTHVVGEIMLD